jgi:hypothetical protein
MRTVFRSLVLGAFLGAVLSQVPTVYGVDPELKSYVTTIKEMTDNVIGNLDKITIRGLPGDTAGICRKSTATKEVVINRLAWQKFTYYDKLVLLMHELLHCEKNAVHINGTDNFYCPNHIMNERMGSSTCNKYRIQKYIKQVMEYK